MTSRNYLAASELGVWHWSKNEPGRAKELLNEALQWRPFYSEAEKALGDISLAENKNDEAEVHYQNALKFNPTFVEGTVGLGVARLRKNDFATAEQLFRQAIQIHAGDPRTHANLGIALQQQHKNEEAIAEFHNALDLAPNLPSGYLNLATALGEQGRVDEAERVFSTGIERAAKNIELREGYAAFLNSSGKIKKAATEYRQILELKPDSVQTLNNLAWILATTSDETVRDGREAIALGQRACDLTKNKIPVVLGTLAAAYAEAGQFSNAVQKATEARMLALEQNDQAVAAKNERLITLYREGKTARDLK